MIGYVGLHRPLLRRPTSTSRSGSNGMAGRPDGLPLRDNSERILRFLLSALIPFHVEENCGWCCRPARIVLALAGRRLMSRPAAAIHFERRRLQVLFVLDGAMVAPGAI